MLPTGSASLKRGSRAFVGKWTGRESVHELSIAMSLIDLAAEEAERRNATVVAVHLRIGPLSGVVVEALRGAFEMARVDTPLADAKLVIVESSVSAWCSRCQLEQPIASIQHLVCPVCQTPAPDVRSGKELEVTGLEIVDGPLSGGG